MVFIGSRNGLNPPAVRPPFQRSDTGFVSQSNNTASLIAEGNQRGDYKRRLMRWKTPNLGWVQMFLNPQQISINERKDIESTRTKAGFILQYAGEALIEIGISGTTGSAGIEGINVLRAVYRAEQIAFKSIASELDRSAPVAEAIQLSQGFIGDLTAGDTSLIGGGIAALNDLTQIALNIFNQPFPTLASLAANVELYFQGELFRGYFTAFDVTESGERPGLFDYNISFTAHSRQGIRRNFMPWHRQPFNPIGAAGQDPNPLSYNNGEYQATSAVGTDTYAEESTNTFPQFNPEALKRVTNRRDTRSGSGQNGRSLSNVNLEDLL